ncbi:MAG: hypothetical protein AABZ12_03740 [Planctomycetota bacterium]
MIWLLATRGAATKLRNSPFTETAIAGVHSVVYKPGVEAIAQTGANQSSGPLGTFQRGGHSISGVLFSYHGSVAEELLGITDAIDLVLRYRADGQKRRRTLSDVVFVGEAAVHVPALNAGVSELIGVPFRVQIPSGQTVASHVSDAVES